MYTWHFLFFCQHIHNIVVMNAQRPTVDTIQAIVFPPADVQPMNITAPSIEISEDAVRFIFNEQGGKLNSAQFYYINFSYLFFTFRKSCSCKFSCGKF